jgi:hypothetical protein
LVNFRINAGNVADNKKKTEGKCLTIFKAVSWEKGEELIAKPKKIK